MMQITVISQKKRNNIILAGIAGNVLEWYDFAIYGFFAPVFAQLFFPSANPTTSLIAAFGAFAAGFLMRPVGAAFFGRIGDRIGRKRALNLSVTLMAVPTFLIGIMPTFAQIGVTATVLLVLLRMLQGLSVGGEFTSSIVYLTESAPQGKRGLFSSASMAGAFGGILLGSLMGTVMSSTLNDAQMLAWGWRVPFLLGIVVALIGYLIRRHMPESLQKEKRANNPFKAMWKNRKTVLQVSGLNIMSAITFYAVFVFVVTWLVDYVEEPRTEALRLNTFCLLILLLATPLFGFLSDRIGRKRLMLISSVGIALFGYPFIWLMHHHEPAFIFMGQAGIALILSMYLGALPAALTEMFPSHVRVTAVSVGYNLTYAILGGTTPMVAVWLIQKQHDDMAFAWYIVAAAILSTIVLMGIKDYSQQPLRE